MSTTIRIPHRGLELLVVRNGPHLTVECLEGRAGWPAQLGFAVQHVHNIVPPPAGKSGDWYATGGPKWANLQQPNEGVSVEGAAKSIADAWLDDQGAAPDETPAA